jgi:hypothetical protein
MRRRTRCAATARRAQCRCVEGELDDHAAEIPEGELIDALHAEIKPSRRCCALLPLEVLRSGLSAYRASGRTVEAP